MSMHDLPFFPIAGGAGDTGKDGVSPTVTVADISGGHRLTIVDATGTKTVDIMDGTVGPIGPTGQNGKNAAITTATAAVDNTSGNPKVAVTLGGTAQERTFDFSFTGLKGAKGDQGIQGIQGEKGETGATGQDGVGIKSMAVNNLGELVITYTDNNEANLGKIVGEQGQQGPVYALTAEDKAEIVAAVLSEINAQA